MTHRELFHEIMFYGKFDRTPVVHWAGWPETRTRWLAEGLPADVDERKFFNATAHWAFVGVNVELWPLFPEETIEETSTYRVFRAGDGVIQKAWKNQSSIPHYLDFTLRAAADWPKYQARLQPDPGRIPPTLADQIQAAENSNLAIGIGTGSMMGWIRNWMGVENMAYLMHDDPAVYGEMVDTIAELTCWGIDQVVPKMKAPPIMGFGWEDIAGKSGPLVSPEIFNKYVAPGYRKVRQKLEHYGVQLLGVDSDGLVEPLLGPWLAAGVNLVFPIEIGTWNADPFAVRRRYGKELRIVGGFNKLALEHGPAAIDAELERRLPLLKDGGFMLMPDHLITPGTSLANYRYFLERLRTLRF